MNKTLKMIIAAVLVLGLCAAAVLIYVKMSTPDYSDVPLPNVTITMESGDEIHLELYPAIAPNTVANFVSLIEEGYYDGMIFHRVIPGFMIQGGCPNGNGTGGPGYTIKGEFALNGVQNNLSHVRGVLSMARKGDQKVKGDGYNTAGSQFFIMHSDATYLDGQYAAFGRVTDDASLAVVDMIATTKTDASDKPLTEWRIKTITVDTHGVTYTPVKIQ